MSLKKRYDLLATKRVHYEERGRTAAAFTIPSIFPELGDNESTNFHQPFQGVGARAVKSLASKISMAMLPPNTPFFRLTVDEAILSSANEETRGKIEEAMMMTEKLIIQSIEQKQTRTVLNEASKHLVTTGNVLLHVGKKRMRMYPLDTYVVCRNGDGDVTEIIIEECVDKDDLPPELQSLTSSHDGEHYHDGKTVKAYTGIKLRGDHWTVHQEVKGVKVEGSDGKYPEGSCPYLALRMIPVPNESYGRSYVEEHIGSFHALEALRRSIQELAVVAARVVFLVKPNSVSKVDVLSKAENGTFVAGNPDDIHCLQLDKQADMAITEKVAQQEEAGIAQAFLMNSSVQRQAERVTAEEIRTLTNELEKQLGGLYSMLAAELQLPLVKVIMTRLEDSGDLPEFPEEVVLPTIVTGVDGLSRAQEFQQMQVFTQAIAMFGPEVLAQNIKVDEFIKRTGAALNIDMNGLVPSPEEKAQVQQAAQQQQMLQQLAPEALKAKLQQQGQQ